MRISDWSSDVCSSDLLHVLRPLLFLFSLLLLALLSFVLWIMKSSIFLCHLVFILFPALVQFQPQIEQPSLSLAHVGELFIGDLQLFWFLLFLFLDLCLSLSFLVIFIVCCFGLSSAAF